MAINFQTPNGAALLAAFKKAIDDKHVVTWAYDPEGDFYHTPDQWRQAGWLGKTKNQNADPDQQLLARLLIEAAETSEGHTQLVNWLIKTPWNGKETRRRLLHAVSIVKVSSVPETYLRAKQIARDLYDLSYKVD